MPGYVLTQETQSDYAFFCTPAGAKLYVSQDKLKPDLHGFGIHKLGGPPGDRFFFSSERIESQKFFFYSCSQKTFISVKLRARVFSKFLPMPPAIINHIVSP